MKKKKKKKFQLQGTESLRKLTKQNKDVIDSHNQKFKGIQLQVWLDLGV